MTLFSKDRSPGDASRCIRERRSGPTTFDTSGSCESTASGEASPRRSPFLRRHDNAGTHRRACGASRSPRVKSILKVMRRARMTPPSANTSRRSRDPRRMRCSLGSRANCVSDRTHEPTRACSERACGYRGILRVVDRYRSRGSTEQAKARYRAARFVVVEERGIVLRHDRRRRQVIEPFTRERIQLAVKRCRRVPSPRCTS